MFQKEALTVLFVSLFAIASLSFVFYSESSIEEFEKPCKNSQTPHKSALNIAFQKGYSKPSITGAITGFAVKSFLDTANEAVQGLIKTSSDVVIENPLRVSKSIEDLFEIQVSEGKEVTLSEKVPILIPPAEWCSRNWRDREECTKTGGNITGKVTLISNKPEYFCVCDCVTLLGGKNESVINNRRCVCKNPNLEILGTPPRCQTKCSNTGGRHENNDPTKPCVCPSEMVYIQNAGCTKVIFQNQTVPKPPTQNISTAQQASLTPIATITTTPSPSQTKTPTPAPSPSPLPTKTPIPSPRSIDHRLPAFTPTRIPTPPAQNCKSLLNNLAKQQYDSFLRSWPQINLMAQQPNFRGQFEKLRNQLEHALRRFVEYESDRNRCEDDIAENVIDYWLSRFDDSFKKLAVQRVGKQSIKGRSK